MERYLKLGLWIFLTGFVAVSYQNCGSTDVDASLFDSDSSGLVGTNCLDGLCYSSDDVYLRIRESNPMRVSSFAGVPEYFRVSGTCGVGGFEEHLISWELTAGQGRTPLGTGETLSPCDLGRFSVAILPQPLDEFIEGVRFFLTLTIVGIEDGARVESTSVSRSGSVEVLLTSEDLFDPDAGYSPEMQICRRLQRARVEQGLEQDESDPSCPIQADLEPDEEEEL